MVQRGGGEGGACRFTNLPFESRRAEVDGGAIVGGGVSYSDLLDDLVDLGVMTPLLCKQVHVRICPTCAGPIQNLNPVKAEGQYNQLGAYIMLEPA